MEIYNITVHQSTYLTPFRAFHGRDSNYLRKFPAEVIGNKAGGGEQQQLLFDEAMDRIHELQAEINLKNRSRQDLVAQRMKKRWDSKNTVVINQGLDYFFFAIDILIRYLRLMIR